MLDGYIHGCNNLETTWYGCYAELRNKVVKKVVISCFCGIPSNNGCYKIVTYLEEAKDRCDV